MSQNDGSQLPVAFPRDLFLPSVTEEGLRSGALQACQIVLRQCRGCGQDGQLILIRPDSPPRMIAQVWKPEDASRMLAFLEPLLAEDQLALLRAEVEEACATYLDHYVPPPRDEGDEFRYSFAIALFFFVVLSDGGLRSYDDRW